jgi:hypothetical protein
VSEAIGDRRMDWWEMLIVALALWSGARLGWPSSLDLGRNEGEWFDDLMAHTGRGVLWVLPAAIAVLVLDLGPAVFLMFAGSACGAAYEAAWRIPSAVPGLRQGPELGEVLFGSAIGAALAVSVVV